MVTSPVTASVYQAIGRGLAAATGSAELWERRVGVIGLGKVGGALAAQLADSGASLLVCDLDPERCESFVARHGGEIAPSGEAIMASPLDVLAPCAAGGTIDEALAGSLDCGVIAGLPTTPSPAAAWLAALPSAGSSSSPTSSPTAAASSTSAEWYGSAAHARPS